jgi:hypothetical protein
MYQVTKEGSGEGGYAVNIPLVPGGSDIPVTKDNLVSYLYLYANFKLNVETHRQSRAFLSGFRDIIPLEWIRMFSAKELQLIIGGDTDKPLDVQALKMHCTYSGGYHPSQPYIQVAATGYDLHFVAKYILVDIGILEHCGVTRLQHTRRAATICDQLLATTFVRLRPIESTV